MSFKTKAPPIKEDPTTTRLREQAEMRAENERRIQGQSYAESATRKILRRFGMLAQKAGAGGIANFNPFVLDGLSLGAYGPGESRMAPIFLRRTSGGLSLGDREDANLF